MARLPPQALLPCRNLLKGLERETGIEPATSSLGSLSGQFTRVNCPELTYEHDTTGTDGGGRADADQALEALATATQQYHAAFEEESRTAYRDGRRPPLTQEGPERFAQLRERKMKTLGLSVLIAYARTR
jgi:hypothetical protein